MRLAASLLATFAALSAICRLAGSPEPLFTVTNLGVLPEGSASYASAINGRGIVVVTVDTTNATSRAFLYDGTAANLQPLPGGVTATGINAAGVVVGWADNGSGNQEAFVFTDDEMDYLGTFPGGNYSAARAINDASQVVGISSLHAFLYSNGAMRDLGHLGGGISDALAINQSGQVVGWSILPVECGEGCPPREHAFLFDGSMHDLGTLGGRDSSAFGVNDSGAVAGWSRTHGDLEIHPFIYKQGKMTDLGTLGGSGGGATGINNAGTVVGYSMTTSSFDSNHAFRWDGTMHDLNDDIPPGSGWVLTSASAINSWGQIVGVGLINNEQHAFLLTPTTTPPVEFTKLPDGAIRISTVGGTLTSAAKLDGPYYDLHIQSLTNFPWFGLAQRFYRVQTP